MEFHIKEGWQLNPNEKVVKAIVKGIERCEGECPCNNDSEDKRCPCSNLRLHNKCCCNLYIPCEIWKPIKGFEGEYEISNFGQVKSLKTNIILHQYKYRGGYLEVHLRQHSKKFHKKIHRLVAEAFIPNPNNYPEVNHKDENKKNNCVENLEWCTSEYNTNYGTLIERLSKKVRAVNVKTGEVITFNSTQEAGRKGYSQSGVTSACRGIYKSPNGNLIRGDGRTYKGHKWSYE